MSSIERKFRQYFFAAVLGSCLVLLQWVDAQAQQPERQRTVSERFAPVHRAEGLPVGAMRLYPRLGLGLAWTDNVFANNELEISDRASKLLAEAILISETSLYSAQIGAQAEVARFKDFGSNDYDNTRFWITGDKDFRSSKLTLAAELADLVEPRTSVNAVDNSTKLTQYSRSILKATYTYSPSRWIVRLDGEYRELDYEDAETLAGPIDNDDRNREVLDFGIRFGYEMSELYGLFLEPRLINVEYEQRVDNDGFERSSNGYDIRLGTDLKFTGAITGELFIGYLNRNFDDPEFDRVQGPSFGGEIDWNIRSLTTLNLGASRTTDATTHVGASTIVNTRFLLGLDHELRRNLVLRLDIETSREEFEGIQREDDIFRLEFGAEYRVNRKLWIIAAYRYLERDTKPTDAGGRDFNINAVTFDVIFQL